MKGLMPARMQAAIEECGASPAAIADRLGCSRSTVYKYLRRHPALKAAFEAARGVDISEDQVRFTREQFSRAIENSRGIKTVVAQRVGCTRQTVDNALERWPDLRRQLSEERDSIIDLAEVKLLQQLSNDDMRAILFTLSTLGKDRGWSQRREVTGANGEALFSSDIMALVREMGLEPSEVVRQFEAMVRAAAEDLREANSGYRKSEVSVGH